MSTERRIIELREIPDTCFFQKLEKGWVHFRRTGNEPGEGAENYCWLEGNYLDAADYQTMLPSAPVILSDVRDAPLIITQKVPLRISAGKVRGKKNPHCDRIIDHLSIFHREWFYMLQNKKRNGTWAESRTELLSDPARSFPLKRPFGFASLNKLSQAKVPVYTSYKTTADFNNAFRAIGAKLDQPLEEKSDLMDWEKPIFTLINVLTEAYFCAYKFSHGISEVGHDIRERLANKHRGKRKTAYQFSSKTITERMVGLEREYNFSLDEKIIIARVTAVNPADFILSDECRRHYYELLIATSGTADGKPVKQITENAVQLLINWHDNIPTDDEGDDIRFLTEIWRLLNRKPLSYNISPMHIRIIAAQLGIPGPWQYLRQQTAVTN